MMGYDAIPERLQPEAVLFFGSVPDGCRGNVLPAETFSRRFDELRDNRRGIEP